MKKLIAVFIMAMVFVAACAFPVHAADSPSGESGYKIDLTSFASGAAVSSVSYTVKGDTIELHASSDSQYIFTGWYIEGEYEVVSETVKPMAARTVKVEKAAELVIRPLSDLVIEESYDVVGSQGYTGATTPSKDDGSDNTGESNNSSKAPQTGDAVFGFVALLTVGALAVVLYSRKRIHA